MNMTPDTDRWPRITIVTPSFNQGQFLEETIRSVLLQGHPNLEYIIVDGGSTDESVRVIKKYEPWLAWWISEQDKGQSHAINKGWKKSSGEILAWINSDDLYQVEALRIVANAFQSKPECLVLVGATALTDVQLNVRDIKKPYTFDLARLLKGGLVPGQPAVFLKKEVFETIGGLDESLHYSLDRDYWIRISMRYPPSRCVYLDDVLAAAREWEGAKTATGYYSMKRERYRVLEKAFSDHSLPEEYLSARKQCFGNLKSRLVHLAFKHAHAARKQGDTLAAWRYAVEGWFQSPSIHGLKYALRFCLSALFQEQSRRKMRLLESKVTGMMDYYRSSATKKRSWGGPFNNQEIRKQIFLELLNSIDFSAIVETGTFRGTTTEFLHQASGLRVYTVENAAKNYGYAKVRFLANRKISVSFGDSSPFLRELSMKPMMVAKQTFFYLDAHWKEDLPLRQENEIIFNNWKNSLVMVDDFQVPGDEGYGYDDYGEGNTLALEYLSPLAPLGLTAFFPTESSTSETGKKRGCIVLVRNARLVEKVRNMKTLRYWGLVK